MDKIQNRNKTHSKNIARNRNKIRHRLSDAKWRANLASCYAGLGRVLMNSELSCKRKVTKATILKETVNHILFLENTIEALMREKAHRNGNVFGPLPWENSLDYFRSDFLVHEKELGKEVSYDTSNFTNTISSHPVISTKLEIPNKIERIIPISSVQPLNDGFCIEDHCYHLTSSTCTSYLTSKNQASLQVMYPQQNELNTIQDTRKQKSNKDCNSGGKRKPLKEINNIILKTKTKKRLTQDYIEKCKTRIGSREKNLGIWNESTPLSRFWTSSYIFSSQATPTASHYSSRKYDIQSIVKPKEKCEFINGVRRRIFNNGDENAISYIRSAKSTKNDHLCICHNQEDELLTNVSEILHDSSSDSIMKKSVTDFQDSSFQSPFRNPNICYYCPPTPMKAKFKESPLQKKKIRTRRALEKLMNKVAYAGSKHCQVNNNADFATEANAQDAKLTGDFLLSLKENQETSSIYLNNDRHFNNSKLSKEVLKAPVIMKIQKATGSLQDKSHDQVPDKEKSNNYSHSDDPTLDYMNSHLRESDLFKSEETNQEVPDNEILHKKKLQSGGDVPHLPEVHCHNNGNIVVLLLCKNGNSRDQEVPKLHEAFHNSNSQLNNQAKYNDKSFIYPLCKSCKDNFDDSSEAKVPGIYHSLPEKSNTLKQDPTYEGMLKNSPNEIAIKHSNGNSHNFLIQEQDPILTSANFTMNQISLIEHPHKNCLTESPSKNSTDHIQHTACQQTGCCWSPCQELSAATLFDTGYHETNE